MILPATKSDVQNGTLGVIKNTVDADDYVCVVELEDLDEKDNKRLLEIDWLLLFKYIDFLYCLTLHKLQSSQAPKVIVLVERGMLLDRIWLYTAVTRAEDKELIFSKKADCRYAANKQGGLILLKQPWKKC